MGWKLFSLCPRKPRLRLSKRDLDRLADDQQMLLEARLSTGPIETHYVEHINLPEVPSQEPTRAKKGIKKSGKILAGI